MSRFLIAALLLGSTSVASVATAQDRGARQPRSERAAETERSDRTERRSEREARSRRAERQEDRTERAVRVDRADRPAPAGGRAEPRLRLVEPNAEPIERIRSRLRPRAPDAVEERSEPVEAVTPRNERRAGGGEGIERRNLRRAPQIADDLRGGEDLVQPRRPLPRVLDRKQPGTVGRTPEPGVQAPEPVTAFAREARPERRWNGDWRRDRRYDWSDHRRRHRRLFRLGFYYDPFGWSYRRYGIGWRLWPSYYSRSFWLHDPWMYRLPPAYGPYRWVRYWDDALLVNIYTGQVVDVIHNFFW